jgi:hypothetical protein
LAVDEHRDDRRRGAICRPLNAMTVGVDADATTTGRRSPARREVLFV